MIDLFAKHRHSTWQYRDNKKSMAWTERQRKLLLHLPQWKNKKQTNKSVHKHKINNEEQNTHIHETV